jgi:hypothetical protein
MKQAIRRFPVSCNVSELGDRRIAQRIVPRSGIDPRIRFVGGEPHRRSPRPEQ